MPEATQLARLLNALGATKSLSQPHPLLSVQTSMKNCCTGCDWCVLPVVHIVHDYMSLLYTIPHESMYNGVG